MQSPIVIVATGLALIGGCYTNRLPPRPDLEQAQAPDLRFLDDDGGAADAGEAVPDLLTEDQGLTADQTRALDQEIADAIIVHDGPLRDVPYAGTCLQVAFDCFDYNFPCTQTAGGNGLTLHYQSGATYLLNFRTGQATATSSAGQRCFQSTPDSADTHIVHYDTPWGAFTVDRTTQTVTCPDGQVQQAGMQTLDFDSIDRCPAP
jgi:hypothetical protein